MSTHGEDIDAAARAPTALVVIPHSGPRMESGPVQFGDDWPGMFLRGDDACPHGYYLGSLIGCLERGLEPDVFTVLMLKNFAQRLCECNVGNLDSAGSPATDIAPQGIPPAHPQG